MKTVKKEKGIDPGCLQSKELKEIKTRIRQTFILWVYLLFTHCYLRIKDKAI